MGRPSYLESTGFDRLFPGCIFSFGDRRRLSKPASVEGLRALVVSFSSTFSTGLFFGTIVFMSFYEYRGSQEMWALYLSIVGGICFARLNCALNPASWKRQFVYGVIYRLHRQ
jgi:hypothetical protein